MPDLIFGVGGTGVDIIGTIHNRYDGKFPNSVKFIVMDIATDSLENVNNQKISEVTGLKMIGVDEGSTLMKQNKTILLQK